MSKFRLSRRTILRGTGLAGVSLALPPLEAMFNSKGLLYSDVLAQAASGVPKRLVFVHWPNGSDMRDFTPSNVSSIAPGSSAALPTTLPRALSSLNSNRNDFNLITGFTNTFFANATFGDDHDRLQSTLATAVANTSGGAGGPSFDQVVAGTIGQSTVKKSLVVSPYPSNRQYQGPISYAGANSAVNFQPTPRDAFNYVFGTNSGGGGGGSGPADTTNDRRKSIIDFIKGDATRLKTRLGKSDGARVDQHLAAVRELEKMLNGQVTPPTPPPVTCSSPTAPTGTDNSSLNGGQRADLLADIAIMALQCNMTNVVTYSLGATNNINSYDFLGMSSVNSDHETSHERTFDGQSAADNYFKMTQWKISIFARFLQKLKATPEGNGTMLDNTIIVAASEMSMGHHKWWNLPVLVAGGSMTTGKHLVVPCQQSDVEYGGTSMQYGVCYGNKHTPIANLWLTIMQALGVNRQSFGNSTGTIAGLWI